MQRYILFTEEELQDLLNGGESEHYIDGAGTVYFMSVDQFAKMAESMKGENND